MWTRLIVFSCLTVTATQAAAQTKGQARAIRDRAQVFVVAQDGTWTGRLLDMDASKVTILEQGGTPRTWPLTEVRRVDTDKWDSPWDGAAAGGVAMAAWSLIAGLTYAAEATSKSAMFASAAATGALMGGWIDARHRSRVTVSLFKRPDAPTVTKAPGLFVTVRF